MNTNEESDKKITTKPKNIWSIIISISLICLLIVIGLTIYFYINRGVTVKNIITPKAQKSEVKAISKLDGTTTTKSLAERYPLAVMVENHPEARPQSGLNKASIVYEAIAEGGITRFMAIYSPNDAQKVGPVRSARTYFVDWASELNSYFAHVGGNMDALEMIKADSILDLDQFGLGEPTYWRELNPAIALEHTMYTKTDYLYKAAQAKKYPTISNFESLSFRSPKPDANTTTTQSIAIDFSTPSYKIDWEFSPQTNTYLRTMAGLPHKDAVTGDRLSTSNLIIAQVERWEVTTSINEQGWAMKTIGSGKAKIFIEGKEIDATWKKASRTSRTLFFDVEGKKIKFIPGTFWYEITPPEVFNSVKVS